MRNAKIEDVATEDYLLNAYSSSGYGARSYC